MNKLGTILVGVDFSPCSAAALRQAMRIAAWNRSALQVLHVVETLIVVDLQETLGVMQEPIVTAMKDDARKAWGVFSEKVAGAAGLTFEVEINSATAALSRRADELGAGLLVMGTHGIPGKKGVGPIAAACVRHAPTDVLLVQEPHDRKYTTVVACVDFSETSLRAVDQAIRVAAQDGATLVVIHAFTSPWDRPHLLPQSVPPALEGKYQEMMLARIEEFCKPFKAEMAYLKPQFKLIDATNHGHGLGQFTRQIGADLVVLGTRGRTNLRDILLGSTAERVLRDAPCSILAVKPVSKK